MNKFDQLQLFVDAVHASKIIGVNDQIFYSGDYTGLRANTIKDMTQSVLLRLWTPDELNKMLKNLDTNLFKTGVCYVNDLKYWTIKSNRIGCDDHFWMNGKFVPFSDIFKINMVSKKVSNSSFNVTCYSIVLESVVLKTIYISNLDVEMIVKFIEDQNVKIAATYHDPSTKMIISTTKSNLKRKREDEDNESSKRPRIEGKS